MTSFLDFCIENNNTALLSQWDTHRNHPLTPETVSRWSSQKVWWRCEKGHEWQAMIRGRSQGNQCPICSRHMVLAGVNDLATTHPDLVKQWNHTKNGTLTPQQVVHGSSKKVWWVCEKGHEWEAALNSRPKNGCPYCANRKVIPGISDLQTVVPEAAALWHPTRNAPLTPGDVSHLSAKQTWWLCEHGHEWQARVRDIASLKQGCPYCSNRRVLAGYNDLATTHPDIAAQWHKELNEDLTPEMVTPGSQRMIWWICEKGHTWQARVGSRTGPKKHGCPICAGKTPKHDVPTHPSDRVEVAE